MFDQPTSFVWLSRIQGHLAVNRGIDELDRLDQRAIQGVGFDLAQAVGLGGGLRLYWGGEIARIDAGVDRDIVPSVLRLSERRRRHIVRISLPNSVPPRHRLLRYWGPSRCEGGVDVVNQLLRHSGAAGAVVRSPLCRHPEEAFRAPQKRFGQRRQFTHWGWGMRARRYLNFV